MRGERKGKGGVVGVCKELGKSTVSVGLYRFGTSQNFSTF